MVIDPIATGAVYLAWALSASGVIWYLTRRPLASALAGSVGAMAATSALKNILPCNYWAHANDFIIEPFLQLHCLRSPFEALLSLAFHVGVPVLIVWGLSRRLRKPIPLGHCQKCGYDLTGNTSGTCPECGVPVTYPDGQHPESPSSRSRFIRYLLAEGFFAAGAALSFMAAYIFWVEVQCRPATPSSMMPLYAPAVGCAAFLWGLIVLVWQNRQQPPLSHSVSWCLRIGLAAMVVDFFCPRLWH